MSSDGRGYPRTTGRPPEPPDEVCDEGCRHWHAGGCGRGGWCDLYGECTEEGAPCLG